MTLEDSVLRQRLAVMQHAHAMGNVTAACEQFGISRTLHYRWRQRLRRYGVMRSAAAHAGQPAGRARRRRRWSTP